MSLTDPVSVVYRRQLEEIERGAGTKSHVVGLSRLVDNAIGEWEARVDAIKRELKDWPRGTPDYAALPHFTGPMFQDELGELRKLRGELRQGHGV